MFNSNRLYVAALIVMLLLIGAYYAFAEQVEGEVSGVWTEDAGGYLVVGDISIPRNDTLIIEAGVSVVFASDYEFVVNGLLFAEGTEEDSIEFRAQSFQRGAWDHITFNGAGSSSSVLDYCRIIYGYHGIEILNASPVISNSRISYMESACVNIEAGAPIFENCNINNSGTSEKSGIVATDRAAPQVINCTFTNISKHGISIGGSSSGKFIDNEILGVGFNGINLSTATACSLGGNFIYESGQRAISISQGSDIKVVRNICDKAGGGTGIWVYRAARILLLNNTIMRSSQHGIQTFEGSVDIINNISMSNEGDGILVQSTTTTNFGYNDVYNNDGDPYSGVDAPPTDINDNPDLDNDYVPRENSPVIDAGNAAYRDADNTRADIGARFYNQNSPPELLELGPELDSQVQGDQEITFYVRASDEDDNPLFITWFLNGEEVGLTNGSESEYTKMFDRDGEYEVLVTVDDRYYEGLVSHVWEFEVVNSYVTPPAGVTPENFVLSAPYPNPFNSRARIDVTTYLSAEMNVVVYDLSGRQVADLMQGTVDPGTKSIEFDGSDLPDGVYYVSADNGINTQVKSLMLIK